MNLAGWWMSEKLDGVRAYWNGKEFLSRLGNKLHAPDWFCAGLPGEPAFRRLRELARFFSRDQIDFEVQLILLREHVPASSLEPEAVQLGYTTWMRTQPGFDRDPEDAILKLQ